MEVRNVCSLEETTLDGPALACLWQNHHKGHTAPVQKHQCDASIHNSDICNFESCTKIIGPIRPKHLWPQNIISSDEPLLVNSSHTKKMKFQSMGASELAVINYS